MIDEIKTPEQPQVTPGYPVTPEMDPKKDQPAPAPQA